MTNEILLTHIGDLYNKHKKYAIKLKNKLAIGASCGNMENNLLLSFYIIQELENYYKGCSCLEENVLCDFITTANKLL